MTSLTSRHTPQESIRQTAARLSLTLAEASRFRSLELVRRRLSQIEAAYGLLLLSAIVFGLSFAVAATI